MVKKRKQVAKRMRGTKNISIIRALLGASLSVNGMTIQSETGRVKCKTQVAYHGRLVMLPHKVTKHWIHP